MTDSTIELAVLFSFPVVASVLGGLLSSKNIVWFMSLLQSKLTPPRACFRYFWSLCYLCSTIGTYLLWAEGHFKLYSPAMTLYILFYLFNLAYTPLFFGVKRLDLAFFDLIIATSVTFACVLHFYSILPISGLALVPHCLWCFYLTVLSGDFWRIQVGKQKNAVFYEQRYSPHVLYQSYARQFDFEKAAASSNNTNPFFSAIPPNPSKDLKGDLSNSNASDTIRLRSSKLPESLFIPER